MKKYLSTLVAVMLAALSFALTSCGDDDEDDPEPSNGNKIVGTWICENVSITEEYPGTVESEMQAGDFLILNDNGTCKYSTNGASISGKYTYANNVLTVYGNQSFDIPGIYQVKTLTESKLVLLLDASIAQVTYTFTRK